MALRHEAATFAVAACGSLLLLPATAPAAELVGVRIGEHPRYTRVVFDLSAPAKYRVEGLNLLCPNRGAEIRVFLDAATGAIGLPPPRGLIESLVVQPDGSTAAMARIRPRDGCLALRLSTLVDPARVVLDLESIPGSAGSTGAGEAPGGAPLASPGTAQDPPQALPPASSAPAPAASTAPPGAVDAPLPPDASVEEPRRPRARPRLRPEQSTLLERPDRQRFDEGPTLSVFGRPLIFGGQYTLRARYVDEQLADDGDKVDYVRLNNELRLDAFYPWTEQVSAYLQGRFVNRNLLWATNEDADDEWDAEVGEAWLFLGRLLDTPVSLQVGRQRIFDEREWWWDEEFDAVRLHFDHERLHAEVSVADTLAPISTDLDRQDPEKQDISRVFGRAIFEWAPNQEIGLYGLHQNDHSDPHFLGQVVDGEEEEDESDGKLTWLGVSALGRRPIGRVGRLAYWLDAAYVFGDETFYRFSGQTGHRELTSPANNPLRNIHDYSVRGWGLDVGATWELPLRGRPSLTLGYARGSGRSGMTKQEDRGFRQTGLQDDNWKWRGSVNRYKYYGELLEPELSNLQIFTAAVGFHLLRNSSVTLAYHHYRQVEKADYLRDVNFSADPDGVHRSIGQEVDLMLGIEEWKHVQLELIGGLFRAGAAFGPVPDGEPGDDRVDSQAGDWSYLGVFQFRVNF